MDDERKRNVAVGFTAVLGLAGLLVLLLLFGYVPQFLEGGYYVTVKLPDAGGLYRDSRASLRGIDIGRVEKIELQPPPESDVRVIVKILREDVRLPVGTRAELEAPLLGGSTTITFNTEEVDGKDPDLIQYLSRDGSAVIEGDAPLSVGRIAKQLSTVLDEPMRQFGEVTDKISILATTWNELGENLRQLSAPRLVEDVDAGEVEPNLATVLARADARLAELRSVLTGIDQYVNDEQLRENISATIANARDMTDQVSTSMDELVVSYVAVADDLSRAIGSMQQLVDSARQPDGTLGKMLADPQLYDNLNDAAERLNVAIDELRLLFEKWKAEGVELKL